MAPRRLALARVPLLLGRRPCACPYRRRRGMGLPLRLFAPLLPAGAGPSPTPWPSRRRAASSRRSSASTP
eukprot:11159489-Lingulodinium_polyedra.AAC.1